MLQQSKNLRERILAIGSFGSGKSYAWLSIARKAQKTGSKAKFYCIDTDLSIERMLTEEFSELRNVELECVFEWEEYTAALDKFKKISTPQDWIIVDMIDIAWEAVQGYFTEEIFSKDIGQFFIEARKSMKPGDKKVKIFDGWKDWQIINRLYFTWVNKLIYQSKSHIFATAKVEKISDEDEDKNTRLLFGQYGVKPRGQKYLGHQFHTVLLLNQFKANDYRITTIKDRGRKVLEGASLRDFSIQYLVGVAKWKI